ncbi:NAD(P)H-hydrate epimerase [Planctomycetota bacterium]
MEKYSPHKKTVTMTAKQLRDFDYHAINTLGIPGAVLMENAGRSCAELVLSKLADTLNPKVCIFCGTGNNGGDGYVIARHLLNKAFKVTVVICGNPEKVKDDAKTNLDILKNMNLPIEVLDMNATDIKTQVRSFTTDYDMIVDAIFGTGLSGQLRGCYLQLIDSINACKIPTLAVDIPSGLDCDTAEPLSQAIKADYTVTFVAVKKGFALDQARDYTGEIFVASIGIDPGNWLKINNQ